MSLLRQVVLAALLCCGLLAGCSVSVSNSARQANQHAEVAGTVMLRSIDPIPAEWAAYQVAGRVGDTTIEAMSATGTTWQGSVVLRITVTIPHTGFGQDETSIRCYSYGFQHRIEDYQPHRLGHCPAGAALV
ncbi:MAG: hypothetical protein ABI418_21620, partial [Jatrophihabitantaceae bacterium]